MKRFVILSIFIITVMSMDAQLAVGKWRPIMVADMEYRLFRNDTIEFKIDGSIYHKTDSTWNYAGHYFYSGNIGEVHWGNKDEEYFAIYKFHIQWIEFKNFMSLDGNTVYIKLEEPPILMDDNGETYYYRGGEKRIVLDDSMLTPLYSPAGTSVVVTPKPSNRYEQ